MINKIVGSFDEAVADITDGVYVLIGGFGGPAEWPSYLIAAVARKEVKDLTIVGNTGGWGQQPLEIIRTRGWPCILRFPPDCVDPGMLVERGQVKKGILAFPAAPSPAGPDAVREGGGWPARSSWSWRPRAPSASASERPRAASPRFYTPVGAGTVVEEGKEVREFNGRSTCWSTRSRATSPSSAPTKPTASATWSTAARLAPSTPPWPAPRRHHRRGGRGGGAGRARPGGHRHARRLRGPGRRAAQGAAAWEEPRVHGGAREA